MAQPSMPVEAGVAVLVAGAFVKALPPAAAALAICWYCILIWQSDTGKVWRARWRRLLLFQHLTTDDRFAFLALCFGGVVSFLVLWSLGKLLP